jgi:hypothetical protein
MLHAPRSFLPALLVLLAAGCATKPSEQPAAMPNAGPVGGILLVRDLSEGQGRKVIVASYVFRAGGVQAKDAVVAFGDGRTPRSEGADYRIRLVDASGAALSEYAIGDPRKVVVEKKGLVEIAQATYAARFAFDARARQIQVTDRQGNLLALMDVGPAIRAFCAKAPKDADCAPSDKRS